MRRFKSDIPSNVVELTTREFRRDGGAIYHRITDCLLNGEVVGQRAYNEEGQLVTESPLRNGLKHGREYDWNDDGTLSLIEPYVNGKIHGTAKQYGRDGSVIGTYSLRNGTGYDIWRVEDEDGAITISEIHTLRDGLPHGYEWWLSNLISFMRNDTGTRASITASSERSAKETVRSRYLAPHYLTGYLELIEQL